MIPTVGEKEEGGGEWKVLGRMGDRGGGEGEGEWGPGQVFDGDGRMLVRKGKFGREEMSGREGLERLGEGEEEDGSLREGEGDVGGGFGRERLGEERRKRWWRRNRFFCGREGPERSRERGEVPGGGVEERFNRSGSTERWSKGGRNGGRGPKTRSHREGSNKGGRREGGSIRRGREKEVPPKGGQ